MVVPCIVFNIFRKENRKERTKRKELEVSRTLSEVKIIVEQEWLDCYSREVFTCKKVVLTVIVEPIPAKGCVDCHSRAGVLDCNSLC